MTPPTPTEVEELARELRFVDTDGETTATWILARFVRREEHERALLAAAQAEAEVRSLRAEVREWLCETCRFVYPGPPMPGLRCVVCPQCSGPTAPRHTVEMRELRAELKDQRCDGSGFLHFMDRGLSARIHPQCPGCPACKPKVTPTTNGSRARESVSTAEAHRRAASPASDADQSTAPVCTHQWTAATDGSSACAICGLYLATIQGPVGGLTDDEQWQLDAAERDKKRAADELRRWRYRIAIARFIDRRARPGDSTPERDALVAVYEANVLLAELASSEEK